MANEAKLLTDLAVEAGVPLETVADLLGVERHCFYRWRDTGEYPETARIVMVNIHEVLADLLADGSLPSKSDNRDDRRFIAKARLRAKFESQYG